MEMDEKDLSLLEAAITNALIVSIAEFEMAGDVRLKALEPPKEVVHAAAKAAAQVLVSWELGWRMRASWDE